MRRWGLAAAFAAMLVAVQVAAGAGAPGPSIGGYSWTKVYDGGGQGWAGRAGLQAVELRNRLFIMGGRTPDPRGPFDFTSVLWNDVWRSDTDGRTWNKVADAPWAARGYFQAVTTGGAMYVIGGQNFKAGPPPVCRPTTPPTFVCSDFFADVWRSTDGANWKQMTASAPFGGRAGLSAIVFKGWIYVLGGGRGDDDAIGGSGRELFNDVWRSRDGARWDLVTDDAPWTARAGAAIVEHRGELYLLGGEDGFLCTPVVPPVPGAPPLDCPYFNDVWRSSDGKTWTEVTPAAGWSTRPGHQCQALFDQIVCFGGFGWPVPADPSNPTSPPFLPGHPSDVWTSRDGAAWTKVSNAPWNATSSADVKYDFDSLVVRGGGDRPAIMTFGGDREVSFIQPDASLVDDEVWRFAP